MSPSPTTTSADDDPEQAAAERPTRDTEVRGTIKLTVKLALFAKNAGRCTLCNRSVIGKQRTHLHSINAAELAHVVGATDTPGSPRGKAARPQTPVEDREDEDNLILACHDCHRLIDNPDQIHLYSADALREIKRAKEERVEMVTIEGILTQTAVLRLGSDVRGRFTMASGREVAEALFSKQYLPLVQSERTGQFHCRLTGAATDDGYWAMARSQITKSLHQLDQAVADQEIHHISVFAIAPIPALVYLGCELDDKVETTLWPKQRDAGWSWPDTGAPVTFSFTTEVPEVAGSRSADDVVLICSLSGEVDPSQLPDDLVGMPRMTLRPDESPSPTLLTHEKSLTNFATSFRQMLGAAEWAHPGARRWHLVGALPVTAAIETGRAFMRDSQPPVEVYQFNDDRYEAVMTVNEPHQAQPPRAVGARPSQPLQHATQTPGGLS